MTIIAICIDGGIVSDVVTDRPEALAGVRVVTIDYDTEGGDSSDFTVVKSLDDFDAVMPDGSRRPWEERLRTVGASMVPCETDAYVREQDIDRAKIDLAALICEIDGGDAPQPGPHTDFIEWALSVHNNPEQSIAVAAKMIGDARTILRFAGANRAADYVQRALKSVQGAARHAKGRGREIRTARAQKND